MGKVIVDLMPGEERVLGFANRWYPLAMSTAAPMALPSGTQIRLIAAPVFLGTKFEAFATRGNGDMVSSHDFEDIISVLDGRFGIEDEISRSAPELVEYLAARFQEITSHPDFENTLPGLLVYDELFAERLESIRKRIAIIAALKSIRS